MPNLDGTTNLSELIASANSSGAINETESFPIFIAPFACRIARASLMSWHDDVPMNATNGWRVALRRYRAGSYADIATKHTSEHAITKRTEWHFDSIPFDPDAQILQIGDAIVFAFYKTNTPPSMRLVNGTVRYEPI